MDEVCTAIRYAAINQDSQASLLHISAARAAE
jgi:hypothetical protein